MSDFVELRAGGARFVVPASRVEAVGPPSELSVAARSLAVLLGLPEVPAGRALRAGEHTFLTDAVVALVQLEDDRLLPLPEWLRRHVPHLCALALLPDGTALALDLDALTGGRT